MRKAIVAAALTLAGIPALAQAQPYGRYESHDEGDVVVKSVEVYVGDLNLSDPRDGREAARRIDGAARTVCEPRPEGAALIADAREYRDCRYEAFDNGMNDLEEQAGHPVRGRVIVREPR